MRTRVKFTDEFRKKAIELAKKGYLDKEICEYCDVNINTFYSWKQKRPDFAEDLRKAKHKINDKIEAQAYKRAMGYMITETKTIIAPNEEGEEAVVRIEKTNKHIPGDTKILMMLLKNRMPERYRDKKEIELSGEVNSNVNINLSTLSDEDLLNELKKIGADVIDSIEEADNE